MPSQRRPFYQRISIDPLWPHYACVGSLLLAVVAAVLRYILFARHDPLHCHSLMTQGQWLDSKFQNWQPEGCMLYSYQPKDAQKCFAKRRIVFSGDSVTRQLFFAFMHVVDPLLPSGPPDEEQKHSHYQYMGSKNIEFSFIWDPFLNDSKTDALLQPSKPASTPALAVLGSGLWYLRHEKTSGGLPAWDTKIESVFKRIDEGRGQIADEIVYLPVEQLVTAKLSPDRSASMRSPDIDAMNADLKHRIFPPSLSLDHYGLPAFSRSPAALPVALPSAFNLMLDPSQTEDGLHFGRNILVAQSNILLNLRCNEQLPKVFPLDKTCCRSYPSLPLGQIILLVLLTTSGPLAWYARRHTKLPDSVVWLVPSEEHAVHLSVFGIAIGLMFITDRTHLFLKEQKQFDPWTFGLLCLFALSLGLGFIKHSDQDLGFLNRQQTDEWKGWMQLAILLYHFFGASKISGIYNPIRVLVASYLFMTGYGHTSFYLKKADFGLLRIAQVLTRINLLTVALAYTMNTDYISYYFSPLVSLWFLIVYATMFVGSQHNERTPFLLLKIFVSAGLVTWFMSEPWLMETLFRFLSTFCNIQWSAKEWAFRVNLDLWIVYSGMLTAVAFAKIREQRLTDHPHWLIVKRTSLAISGVVIIWFFAFELTRESKFTYNAWHPYISVLPILAFVFLRNGTVILRSATSRVFAFIGTCSLETFIMQYHFWLAADTKGILLILPGTRLRPLNFVVSSAIFIYLSHRVAESTGHLTSWICKVPEKAALPAPVTTQARPAPREPSPQPAEQELEPKESESEPMLSESPSVDVHPGGWADRLTNNQETRPGFKIFDGPMDWRQQGFGLKSRLLLGFFLMWVLNITWRMA
ncbi:Cas1p-domain-containing protein [Sistotremastrum suecicum HHB10207 ss-3]|uniref:Cas1p-domain-containing protein n=1 Tax=Sistotremastrum suecicum HHB10207 ss-3 TaxID=1314776 RepID=A0A166JAY6_9AGAM|nr:Cas1p-domain-containing protein [Sistotremastrum suecicum HHB10207 ss-3]